MYIKISDIAKRAGVSKATVSLALNGSERINELTRKRIQQLAQEMGYSPNPAARRLATKRSSQIGLIIPDIENVFYAALVRFLSDAAHDGGYDLMISTSENRIDREKRLIQSMLNSRVEGLILAPVNVPNDEPDYLNEVARIGLPLVFTTSKYPEKKHFCVMSDLYDGMRQIMTALSQKGYRRIMMLSGPENVYALELRTNGYLDSIQSLKLSYSRICSIPEVTYQGALDLISGMKELDCDAIVCVNDMMALGVVNALLGRGVRVPQDIGVAGYDDVIFSRISPVPITTVRQQIKCIAEQSMQMLLDVIEGRLDKNVSVEQLLPCGIVYRNSV